MKISEQLKRTSHELYTAAGELNRPSKREAHPDLPWDDLIGGIKCSIALLEKTLMTVKRRERYEKWLTNQKECDVVQNEND